MHTQDLAEWRHDHQFDTGNIAGERSTLLVMWITAGMMVIEIAAGWFYNSMALLADGFHMSSHAVAIGLSAFADQKPQFQLALQLFAIERKSG